MKGFGWSKVILQGAVLLAAASAYAAPSDSKATATATAQAPTGG
jgi:hypothetical protein